MYVYMYWFEHFLLIYILILKRLKNITLLQKKSWTWAQVHFFFDTGDHVKHIVEDKSLSYYFSKILKNIPWLIQVRSVTGKLETDITSCQRMLIM